jgi:Uncharacterized conserved protein (DUF2190)
MATKFLAKSVTHRYSRQASEALTAKRLVEVNASDNEKVDMCDGANDVACGIVEFDTDAGKEAVIMDGGHLELVAGSGGVAAGNEIVSDNAGKGVAKGTTATTLYNVVGRALTAAAEDEVFILAWGPYTSFGANAS